MLVKDIMTKDVVFVERKTKISEVVNVLFKNRFHAVPVVEDGKIAGIITETDFFTKDSANLFLPSYISFLEEFKASGEFPRGSMKDEMEKLLNVTAEDIMTARCTTVQEDIKLADLLEFFKTTKFTTFPAVDEQNMLVGIVTVADIINFVKIGQRKK